jgi:amidase
MAGKSVYDKATDSIPFAIVPNYAAACQGTCLDGLGIGVPRDAITEADEVVMKHFEMALNLLKSTGATIVEDVKFSGAEEWEAWDSAGRRACLQAEFQHSIDSWLKELVVNPNNIQNLSDIIEFTKADKRECYPERDIQRWEWIKEGPQYGSKEYERNLAKMYRLAGKEGIVSALDEYKLDLVVHPTNLDPATTFSARVGLPRITVPLGFYPEDTEPVSHRGDIVDVAPNVPSVSSTLNFLLRTKHCQIWHHLHG